MSSWRNGRTLTDRRNGNCDKYTNINNTLFLCFICASLLSVTSSRLFLKCNRTKTMKIMEETHLKPVAVTVWKQNNFRHVEIWLDFFSCSVFLCVCLSDCYRCCPFLDMDRSQGTGRVWSNFRRACLLITQHKFFEIFIIFIILLSSIALVDNTSIRTEIHTVIISDIVRDK